MWIWNDERNQDDIKFVQNVKGCEDNGIQYGVYLYSYAVDNDKEKTLEDMARSEAEHVLRMIEEAGAKPTMPVYYDIEDKSQVGMTDKQYGYAEIFCNIVKMPAIRLVFILTIIGGSIDLLIQDLIIGENGLQDIITQVSTTKNMIFGNILSQAR